MPRTKKMKKADAVKNIPVIDVEKAFRQVAGRMEQIRREYGSAEAYQEEFRSKHQSNESNRQIKKRR